jgi:hypothetical protein
LEQIGQEESPARQLKRFFEAGFAFVNQNPDQAPVVINAIYGPDIEFKQRVYKAYDKLFALLIEDIVGGGVAQGDFRNVDPDLATALLMSVYLGACSLLDAEGKVGFASDQVVDFVLQGLRRRDDPNSGED